MKIKIKKLPSYNSLNNLFYLNPSTGIITYKSNPFKIVGSKGSHGYLTVNINGNSYLLHRIIWKLFYKKEPPRIMDHINQNRKDNRICNLRKCNHAENGWNRGGKNGRGLPKGIIYIESKNRYRATISKNRKWYSLGYFKTLKEAHDTYKREIKNYHGEFSRIK